MLDVYVAILPIMLRVESLCFDIVRMDSLESANDHGFVKVVTFKLHTADMGHSGKELECLPPLYSSRGTYAIFVRAVDTMSTAVRARLTSFFKTAI